MNVIEVFTETQIKIVEALARAIWTEHYRPIIGKGQVEYMLGRFQSREAISAQIAGGVSYYLMQENGKFVGYLAVQHKGAELFLSKIYVLGPLRGKGHGRKAIRFVETLAREQGLPKIVLTVNKNNVNAIKAYERWGFRNVGSLVQDIGSGFVMDDYKMEKDVEQTQSS
jgi:ribosomal protein S18 acetylase RimI-like enzyme